MIRVYTTLKVRIMAGEFAPGERLDPARLAPELGVSRTPVRDALIRLSAERLVDSLQHEGFRQPHISEPAIRDLYLWSNELLHVALRAASRSHLPGAPSDAEIDDGYPCAVARCFDRICALSSNLEHRFAIANINDRCGLLRGAEKAVLEHVSRDVLMIEDALQSENLTDVARVVDQFHRRRARAVAGIAAALRLRPRSNI